MAALASAIESRGVSAVGATTASGRADRGGAASLTFEARRGVKAVFAVLGGFIDQVTDDVLDGPVDQNGAFGRGLP